MVEEIRPEEIKAVLLSMNSDKVSRLDCYNPGFCKKSWPILGCDVVKIVKRFFSEVKLSERLNDTMLVLISKKRIRCEWLIYALLHYAM